MFYNESYKTNDYKIRSVTAVWLTLWSTWISAFLKHWPLNIIPKKYVIDLTHDVHEWTLILWSKTLTLISHRVWNNHLSNQEPRVTV